MKKYKFNYKGVTYTRINKTQAEKRFENGETIYLCACNLRPFTVHRLAVAVNNSTLTDTNDFQKVVNTFEYYNCFNSETGKYASYYAIDEKETLKYIYNSLQWHYIFGEPVTNVKYPYISTALYKHNNYIHWSNYGSSANKNTLKELHWIIETIFKMSPSQFIEKYNRYTVEQINNYRG